MTVMKKSRLSALLPAALAAVSLALGIVILVAGAKPHQLDQEYLVSLNTSKIGQNLITFTPTSSSPSTTSSKPSSTSSSSNPFDPLNPFSTSSPLNPQNNDFGNIFQNITSSIDGGFQNGVNQLIAGVVNQTGIRGFYQFFLTKICEGDAMSSANSAQKVNIDRCISYGDTQAGLNKVTSNIPSSVNIAGTTVSVPLIAELTHSISTLNSSVSGLRKAIIALVIISIIGSALTFLSSLPAMFLRRSRLLIYASLTWSSLSSTCAFLAACILTGLAVTIVNAVDGFGEAVSVQIRQGRYVIILIWLNWLFIWLASVYWFVVWFVEVRSWAFVRRRRTAEEKGRWKGVGSEVINDLKGKGRPIDENHP